MHILSLKVTFQETPLLGVSITNILEEQELGNILDKAAAITLNALQLLFCLHLYGEDL